MIQPVFPLGLLYSREPHDELAAVPRPFACRCHRSAVHLDHGFHEGQADAQTALLAGQGRLGKGEEVEDAREQVRRDAATRIPHSDHCIVPLPLHRQPDTAPRSLLRAWTETLTR